MLALAYRSPFCVVGTGVPGRLAFCFFCLNLLCEQPLMRLQALAYACMSLVAGYGRCKKYRHLINPPSLKHLWHACYGLHAQMLVLLLVKANAAQGS